MTKKKIKYKKLREEINKKQEEYEYKLLQEKFLNDTCVNINRLKRPSHTSRIVFSIIGIAIMIGCIYLMTLTKLDGTIVDCYDDRGNKMLNQTCVVPEGSYEKRGKTLSVCSSCISSLSYDG